MSSTSKRSTTDPGQVVVWVVIGAVAVIAETVIAALQVARWWTGEGESLPWNPVAMVGSVMAGRVQWSPEASIALGVLVGLLLLVAVLVLVVRGRGKRRRARVDVAARHMGRGRDVEPITARATTAKAADLGVVGWTGKAIGEPVVGGPVYRSSVEDVTLDVWGPRKGKSSTRVIPAVVEAPGAVVTTSNKRDVVDATRDLRAQVGHVWVFDPQQIVREPAAWWWNPLSFVTDETKAQELAQIFASSVRPVGGKSDDYFGPAAVTLLGNLLHAAALDGRPITQVYLWCTRPKDDEPAHLLEQAGFPLSGAAVKGIVNAPDKQRQGVYGGAQQIVSFLTNRTAAAWVTANPAGERRPHFDPARFAQSTDTLYLLSRKGESSTGPLVTALTVATLQAAEQRATVSSRGRLAVPMVVELDEVANVCRWHQLPDQYSFFGSEGILVSAYLQSYAQGVSVWGKEGMEQLWSAANVIVYGGGVKDTSFLGDVSQLVGDFDPVHVSRTAAKGGTSTGYSTHRERILDVADLAAIDTGRAVVLASGARATLVRTLPWMRGPHAAAIEASIRAHDPAAEATLAEHRQALTTVERDVPTVAAVQADNPWARL